MSTLERSSNAGEPIVSGEGAEGAEGLDGEEAGFEGAPARASGLYRAVWRWHFYAGAFVIPVMITLAVSGGIYLFRPQLEPMMYPHLMRVPLPPAGSRPLPLSQQIAAVEARVDHQKVSRVVTPVDPGRSTQVFTRDTRQTYTDSEGNTSGLERVAYVNPYTGAFLGQQVREDMFMENLRDFHGELMAGWIGDRIVEIAASWALILVGTGFYLWWRGRRSRARQKASETARSGRPKIRRRHATVGAVAGGAIALFVVSGLPWSGYWGDGFQKLRTNTGLGAPQLSKEAKTSTVLTKDLAGGNNGTGWATELLPVPASTVPGSGHEGHGGHGSPAPAATAAAAPIGVDRAAGVFLARLAPVGAPHGYTLMMPEEPTGVYTFQATAPHDPHGSVNVNIDQYSGRVLVQYGFGDYGLLGKGVSQGIALHEGRRFGGLNQLVNLAMVLGVLFLSVTGPMMWWKRRPKGALATAPRRPRDVRALRGAWLVMLLVGAAFPLGGMTMLAVLAVDRFVIRKVPKLSRAFAAS